MVVEPSPMVWPPVSSTRAAGREPAGLTIHRLELQIVERPRDASPERQDDGPASPVNDQPWEWPDRRHATRVW